MDAADETIRHFREPVELLAPAGDLDCVRAAIENGADAVYFGLQVGFNARDRATNFALEQLAELMGLLHGRGLRGYAALNTLAFPAELPTVEDTVRRIAEAGVDAVLVQDLGVVRLVRAVCPNLGIHASTQMTLTSAESIRVAERMGVERVVLARELSIEDIRKIRPHTSLPLEVFVHGALCVAYSGQCLTSESLGGRSANRGQCAQACRLPYELICDGHAVDLEPRVKYLLSPQDLAAYALLPELLDAGVTSFKIEGRLKTPEYVANVTRHYREALDAVLADRPVPLTRRDVEEMELSFSRGFSPGWLRGCDHKMLVPGLSSAKRGVLLGDVARVSGNRVQIRLQRSVKPGDGVVFEGDRANDQEQGGRVYEVFRGNRRVTEAVDSGSVELAFEHGRLDLSRLRAGQKIWKTDDPELTRRLRRTFQAADAQRRIPLRLHVEAFVGQPLRVSGQAATGWSCHAVSDAPLETATKHPLSIEIIQKQLGRLGGTAFELVEVTAHIEGGPMVPLSVLGRLRHRLIDQLTAAAREPAPRSIAPSGVLGFLRKQDRQHAMAERDAAPESPQLRVLCRSHQQLDAVLRCEIGSVMLDFQDIREYRGAVRTARAAGAEVFLTTPRIQKPGELGVFRTIARCGADGILVRNLGGLEYFRTLKMPLLGDHTLNAANDLTVHYLRQQGMQRITCSFDLNRDQLSNLVSTVPPRWLEVGIHQHMPLFHMEHCVFCAVLSPGTNKHNCGRPCDRHKVHLRDRVGMEHPLTADIGCRNTLFNAVPQSAAEAVPALLSAGIRDYRIDLLDESPSDIRRIIDLYRDLLAGRTTGDAVWRHLNAVNRVGVTRGTLEQRRDPLAIL
ncbi:MAG: U32 family peptidase [Planctomycetes bacterium]|nr:U32 family peptidase [Planctomycetota bacterium]